MPIKIICSGCEKTLNVPDHAAGKKIRCPACKAVVPVPALEEEEFEKPDEEVAVSEEPVPSKKKSKNRPPEEEEFEEPDEEVAVSEKPVPSKKKAKKRRDDDDDDDGDGGYGVSEDDEEEEEERRPRKKKKKRRFDDDDYRNDYGDMRPRRRAEPHRGVTILVLGIMTILAACLCPLIAWIMGGSVVSMANNDVPKMERGHMDRSGMGLANAGRICAYIGIFLGTVNAIAGVALRLSNMK